MSNTILTPTAVTRAVHTLLHQKGNFLRRIDKQYDPDAVVYEGRKTGGSVKIRMPNQFTVRSGSVMNVQDFSETSETLTVGTMKGVDVTLTDSELALSLEDLSERILEPAVARLVSEIEKDIITGSINKIGNMIDNDGAAISLRNVLDARRRLIENLVPDDDKDLSLFLSPAHNAALVDALKALFVPGDRIGGQYKSGNMLPAAGVGMVGVNTHLTNLTTGTNAEGDTSYDTDIAGGEPAGTDGSAGINIDTGSGTFKAGEVFEIESVNAVHPETKADLGYRKQFAVLEDAAGGANTLLKFYPISGGDAGIVSSGARQNVSAAPADGKIIYKIGAGNAETLNRSLYMHRKAIAVCFAKLTNPKQMGGAWGDFIEKDGIAVRVWRAGDITNGAFPTRIDVFYGYRVVRPELACRIHADG